MPAVKPNVVVIGAAKAGTTSLYAYLSEHPQVFLPRELKEINFLGGVNQAIFTEEDYLELYRNSGSAKVRVDISTTYLYEPGTAEKIREFLGPDTKIIAMIRNPVEASYSMWKQIRHFGDEPLSFVDALGSEERRRNDPATKGSLRGWPPNYFYKDRNCYRPQLQRYFDIFPSGQIKVIVFEEFFGDIDSSWRELCDFLKISTAFRPKALGKTFNPGSSGRRFEFLHALLYENLRWKRLVVKVLPEILKNKLRLYLDDFNKVKRSEDKIPPATRKELTEFFRGDVRALENLLNRSLVDLWLTPKTIGPNLITNP